MQNIKRETGESVVILEEKRLADIKVLDVIGGRVKLGIDAPREVEVCLSEDFSKRQTEDQQIQESFYYKNKQDDNPVTSEPCPIEKQQQKHRARILLVEDVDIIQITHKSILEGLGYEVDIAKDGREALDKYVNNYDLILLDIGLPHIDGIKVCKRIRKMEANNNNNNKTPIIFLTSHGNGAKKEALGAGGDHFVVKPMSAEKLGKLVEFWVAR